MFSEQLELATLTFELLVLNAMSSRDRIRHTFLFNKCNKFSRSENEENCSEPVNGNMRKRKNKNCKKPS